MLFRSLTNVRAYNMGKEIRRWENNSTFLQRSGDYFSLDRKGGGISLALTRCQPAFTPWSSPAAIPGRWKISNTSPRAIKCDLKRKIGKFAMHEVKLSAKNQIVLPREVRDALKVKAGGRLIIITRGDAAIMMRKPKRYSRAIAAMAQRMYPSDYLQT